MLYYLIKFLYLLKKKPLQIFDHFRSMYEEWSDNRRGQLVNEVMFMVPEGLMIEPLVMLKKNRITNVPAHVERIVWHLNNAKYSIDLAMYTMSSVQISTTLIMAARRGVRVRIVTETNCTSMIDNKSDIPVRQFPLSAYTLMHNKFCIIDGYQCLRELKPEGAKDPVTVSLTGSLNWVNYGDSCDDILITSAPRICKSLELEFYHIWFNCAHTKRSSYK
ncbi:hypothetical protein KR038_004731 [Drosophila bunnanda]|nr:hypothetical protein KR038_004731 [Drosophila bunnanda]